MYGYGCYQSYPHPYQQYQHYRPCQPTPGAAGVSQDVNVEKSQRFAGPFAGAIDIGTSSARFILFDTSGTICFSSQQEVQTLYPHEGWAEHDPKETIRVARAVMEKCMGEMVAAGHSVAEVKSVGITNHRESICVWDPATGEPLNNIIVWLDTRNKEIVQRLIADSEKGQDALRDICGLPLSTYFSACKLKWLLENNSTVRERVDEGTAMFGTIDSWVLWNLTGGVSGGVHVTDVTNASRTMLMNLATLAWDDEACRFFGINAAVLPEIRSSSEVYGAVKGGTLDGVPIAGVLGDQQAALVGQSCFSVGEAKNTYGTGCFMLLNTGTKLVPSTHGLLTTVGYQLGPTTAPVYALEGSVAIAGDAVKWMRDSLGLIETAAEINDLAAQVEDTAGVFFVTAFSGLFAPRWRPEARGAIVGLTHRANKHHIARATLEAVCYQTYEVLSAMEKDAGVKLHRLRVDGGMTASDLTMQIQADILGIDVARPAMLETTALGAAFAGGLAVGTWKSLEEFQQTTLSQCETFQGTLDSDDVAARIAGWNRAVERTLGE